MRNIVLTFDDGTVAEIAAPVDAYKAAIVVAERIEAEYAKLGAFTDLADASIAATGTVPYQIHIFTLTTTVATGTYEFVYVETKPNLEV